MTVSPDSDTFSLQNSVDKPTGHVDGENARRLPTIAARQSSQHTDQYGHRSDRKSNALSSYPPANATDAEVVIDIQENAAARTLRSRIRQNKTPLTAFLSSTLLHVFWILLLLFFSWHSPIDKTIGLLATMESVEVDAEVADPNDAINETLEAFESPIEDAHEDTSDHLEEMADAEVEIAEPVIEVASVMPTAPAEATEEADLSGATEVVIGGSLIGRTAESRAGLVAARGGSPESEQAVDRALRWIVDHQDLYDGGWRFQLKCDKCKNSGQCKSRNAATGLALMALLGAGYTHQTGPYQTSVDYGLKFLIRKQKVVPEYGGSFCESGKGMYHHAIATIALAEAYAMTGDEALRQPLVEAQRYIITAQNNRGGWRYQPGSAGDVLVTGWQVMALKALDQADIATPLSVYERANAFLQSCRTSNGRFRYHIGESKSTPTATAVALLSLMYMGLHRDHQDLTRGCNHLLSRGVSKKDIYFDFYTTLTLHHVRHENWDQWNEEMRDYLVRTQQKTGHQSGSWHFRDPNGVVGGRLYTTAMAAMTLEVYYRYSPLFAAAAEGAERTEGADE